MPTSFHTLEARIEALEEVVLKKHGANTINGWEAAARFLGVSRPTLKQMAKQPSFPKPVRVSRYKRAGSNKTLLRPTWYKADLINQKNSNS